MKKFQAKSALLTLLAVGFVALFSVGCGNSRENFVITNSNNNVAANTGNLVFRFQQAVAQTIVPSNTDELIFSLHSGSPASTANFVELRTVPYADLVTLENVPDTVTTVIVTAIGPDTVTTVDIPIEIFTASGVNVLPGGTVEVAFDNNGQPTPVIPSSVAFTPNPVNLVTDFDTDSTQQLSASVTFDNGSVVSLPVNNATTDCLFSRIEVATVGNTGIVEFDGSAGQNTSATCDYTIGGRTVSGSFDVSTFGFEVSADGAPAETSDGFSGFYGVFFTDDDGQFNPINVNESSTYAFAANAPSGLTIDSATGQITGSSTQIFDVVVTWVGTAASSDGTDLTFSDTVRFNEPD